MSVVTIKVTVPKLLLNPVWAVNAMNEGVETVARGTKRDLEAITKPWRTNVSFQLFRDVNGYSVITNNAIFGYVNSGTRPHIIRARNKKALRFKSGGALVFAKYVRHTGTKPRNYIETVAAKWEKRISYIVSLSIRKAMR